MKSLIQLLAAFLALAHTPANAVVGPQKPLEIEVLQAGPGSLYANFTLIKGEHDAILVDAPFTMADAHRVVAMVLESGKELKYVYVTHDHPDHFFAMEVIQQTFPNAKIVADPVVVADIWRSLPFKVKRWAPLLGNNGPVHPSAPQPIEGGKLILEGRDVQILGPLQGDHVHATAIWIPSTKTLIAGDLVFNQMYLWFGETTINDIKAWNASLEKLETLGPQVVVAGHAKPGLANDPTGITWTKHYIDKWLEFSAKSKNSAELRQKIIAEFPGTDDVLGDFLLGNSSRITMGEEPKWVESA